MIVVFLFVVFVYIGVLFWLVNWGDKIIFFVKRISYYLFVYFFLLGIYCMFWIYYGLVGIVVINSWNYLLILIGFVLLFFFG